MGMYRKKPIVIEAQRLVGDHARVVEIAEWSCAEIVSHEDMADGDPSMPHLMIHTLEGDMKAYPGDWIIKGVNGEFYPCRSEIFDKTYEVTD